MTLLRFWAKQSTEPHPTETLYWAQPYFWRKTKYGMMLVLLLLTLSGDTL